MINTVATSASQYVSSTAGYDAGAFTNVAGATRPAEMSVVKRRSASPATPAATPISIHGGAGAHVSFLSLLLNSDRVVWSAEQPGG